MLNQNVSPQTLGVARIAVFSMWLISVAVIHLEDIAALPRVILEQHGPLRLIPDPLWAAMWDSPAFLVGFKVVLLGCLLWLVLGLPRYTLVAVVTCVLLTLFDGMAKGLGHINHSKMALLYSAYVLAAFPCADAVALAKRKRPLAPPVMYAAPMLAVAMVIMVAYCAIGVHRIGKSGFELFFSNTLGAWFLKRAVEVNPTGLALGLPVLEVPILYNLNKLAFAVTGIFEALSPLCLFSRYFRWAWICTMIPFHVATLLTMNIFFWPNIVIIALFMTDSDKVISRWLGAPRGSEARV